MKRTLRVALLLNGSIPVIALPTVGCGFDLLLNQTALFGSGGADETAGANLDSGLRGEFHVVIENSTPFRALFTTGAYDNTDENTLPLFFQYSPESQFVAFGSTSTLERDSNTGVISMPCARVFSIGGEALIGLINENAGTQADLIDEAALNEGVGFSSAAAGSSGEATPNEGMAGPAELLLGVDFNCGSLIHVTFEINDAGPEEFRVVVAAVFPSGRDD